LPPGDRRQTIETIAKSGKASLGPVERSESAEILAGRATVADNIALIIPFHLREVRMSP
jgi:hypothetical protein